MSSYMYIPHTGDKGILLHKHHWPLYMIGASRFPFIFSSAILYIAYQQYDVHKFIFNRDFFLIRILRLNLIANLPDGVFYVLTNLQIL